ncbi:PAS domain-containing protein [bacterium]|nr:PAS domain-containing protein [bacterium]MBU1635590.1 PAS domain-containing protein [bacterium]
MKNKQSCSGTLFMLIFLLGLQISCDREEGSCIPKCDAKFFTLTHFLNENINEGIVFVSMDGMIQEANQKYLDIIGYTLEEARQLSYEQITPVKWHKMENDLRINQVMKRGFCDIYEKEYIRKDKTSVPIRTQAWLITDGNGEPWRLMGIIKKINPGN